MKKLFEKLFQPGEGKDGRKTGNKAGYVIILGLIGLALILLSNIFSYGKEENPEQMHIQPTEKSETSEETSMTNMNDVAELEKSYKQQLEDMLNKIQGVSEAEVMVNLASTNVHIYEKNLITGSQSTEESDRNGGTRTVQDSTEETQVVFVRQGDREVPITVKTERPEVSGVFVVAKGADHATVKKWIVEAISRVLDVPTHRVSVLPKK